MNISFGQAESFVKNFSVRKARAFWEGWNVVIATENPAGWFKQDGRLIDGKWHRTFVVPPDENGLYRIPKKYAKRR